MSSPARARLESLLRTRKLDGTLASSAFESAGPDTRAVAPTGIAPLDVRLEGGVPRGHLSEIVGPASSGRTSLLHALLVAAAARGELVALVDASDVFDPRSAEAAGLDLARLLWVRGWSAGGMGPRARVATSGRRARFGEARGKRGQTGSGIDRAVKALNLILQSQEFGLVGLDLIGLPIKEIRRIPFTTWMRLHRVIEGSRTACILLGSAPIARSSAGLTMTTRPVEPCGRWTGKGYARLFRGLEIEVRVTRARFRRIEENTVRLRPPVNDRTKSYLEG